MTRIVDIHAAGIEFSRLVERAAAGEEIVITKAGVPMTRLISLRDENGPRKPGCLAGRFHVSDEFDAPLHDDLLDSFEGKPR